MLKRLEVDCLIQYLSDAATFDMGLVLSNAATFDVGLV